MLKDINKKTGRNFNTVLINQYKNGKDNISYHRDDQKNWHPEAGVLTLSFGSKRDFLLRKYLKNPPKNATKK